MPAAQEAIRNLRNAESIAYLAGQSARSITGTTLVIDGGTQS